MRLGKVSITGFGGIPGTVELDLSGDVVILQGANGFGKSTVCDAVTWYLSGAHPRRADPPSLYSLAGETHAAVELVDSKSVSWTVRRKVSNPGAERLAQLESTLVVECGGVQYRDSDAEAWVTRRLLQAPNTVQAASSHLLVDSYYLQQESLREFLVGRSDDERFAALSTMVGAGALEDFVRAFDTARRAWSKSLKDQQDQLETLTSRLFAARARCASLEELSRASQMELPDVRERWLSAVRRVLQRVERTAPIDLTLDTAMRLLRDLDLEWRRRAEAIRIALAEAEGVTPPAALEGPAIPQDSHRSATAAVHEAAHDKERATEAVRTTRRALEAQRAEREDLAGLATIALRHVSANCPTCGQGVDPADLRSRLEAMVQASRVDPLASALEQAIRVEEEIDERLAARVAELTRLQAAVDAEQRALAAHRAYEQRQGEASAQLDDLLASAAVAADLDREVHLDLLDRGQRTRVLLDRLRDQQVGLSELLAEGGSLEARIQAASRANSLRAAEMQVAEAERAHVEKAAAVAARQATGTVADLLMREMKRDSEAFLNSRLREMQPLLDQLYAAIEPHPTFRSAALETRNWYGKNRLDAVARDTARGVVMPEPGRSLSTSQANAMAVTVFLAFNLGLAPTALQTVVLDDPLQNLDDVHLLGLVDLLRRITPHRQIVVTTHDRHFGSLLARKLRPTDASRRVSVVDIVSWDRSGPTFGVAQVEPDLVPMKLARAVA